MKDSFLLRLLIWICENTATFSLIVLFLISISPFFYHSHGERFYSVLGGYCALCSMFFVWLDKKNKRGNEGRFAKVGVATIITGVLSLIFISEDIPIEFNLFFYTYRGALMGLWLGAFLFFGKHNYNATGK